MIDFIQKNWFQIIIATSVVYSLVKAFYIGIRQKAIENNHLMTLTKRVENLEKEVFKINERLARIEGKLNGK